MPLLDDPGLAEEISRRAEGWPAHPLVSIVVVSFNYARYLPTAIDSALGQTHPEIEVVVVDDGSTDGSQEIIAGYGVRIRPIFKRNGGEVSASNAGFKAARGDIVLFLDSDDFLMPDAVERIVAALRPGVSAVQASVMMVDADGCALGSMLPPLPRNWTPERIRRTLLRTGNYPHPPTSGNAYPRWFLERLLPVDPMQVPSGLDGLLNRAAALHGDVVALGSPLAAYRLHGSNMGAADVTLDPARLHLNVARDLPINAYLLQEAQRIGASLASATVERGFYFAQYRLASCKLRPDCHPIAGDTLARVLGTFVVAAALAPDPPLRKAMLAAWGLAMAAAPAGLAARLLDLRFSSRARPLILERLLSRLQLVRRIAVAGTALSLLDPRAEVAPAATAENRQNPK